MPTFIQVVPSSVSTSGGSASITSLGSVEYSSASTITVNGVFTSANEFYLASHTLKGSSNDEGVLTQLCLSASADTGTNYTRSLFYPWADIYNEATSQAGFTTVLRGNDRPASAHSLITGVAAAEPTSIVQTVQSIISGSAAVFFENSAVTHSQSVAYDGIKYTAFNGGTITGRVSFYKMEE